MTSYFNGGDYSILWAAKSASGTTSHGAKMVACLLDSNKILLQCSVTTLKLGHQIAEQFVVGTILRWCNEKVRISDLPMAELLKFL